MYIPYTVKIEEDGSKIKNGVYTLDRTDIIDFTTSARNKLKILNVDSDIPIITYYLCSNCFYLTEANLHDNIRVIDGCAFEDCPNLKTINMPKNIEIIGSSAFMNCQSLTEMTIPPTIRKIYSAAFFNCPNLELNIKTSLFNTTFNQDISFINTFDVRKLNIYDVYFDIQSEKPKNICEANILNKFYKLQKRELKDRITYVLNTYKLKYEEEYFKPIIDLIVEKLHTENNFNYEETLVNEVANYVMSKNKTKYIFPIFKNKLNKFIDSTTKTDIPKNEEEPRILPQLKNHTNDFENKTIEEVYQLLNEQKFDKIENNNVINIIEYGNELSKYLHYISNYYVNIIQNKINDNENILRLKEILDSFKNNNEINIDSLENINIYIQNQLNEYNNEINKINGLKKIIYLYINKLDEQLNIIKEYNNNLINDIQATEELLIKSITNDKIHTLELSKALVIQKIEEINLSFAVSLKVQNVLDYLKNTGLPLLIMNIADNNMIIDKKINIDIIQNISELFNQNFSNKQIKKIKRINKKQ